MTRCGFVAVVGLPNVGKSTLLNRLIGEKLAITSRKPQSTRSRVVGLLSGEEHQAIVVDTPGLLDPAYQLQESLRSETLSALHDADLVLHVSTVDDLESLDQTLARLAPGTPLGVVLHVVNKADTLADVDRARLEREQPPLLLVSALTGLGVDHLRETILRRLPEGPLLYPGDDISTQHTRFFAAEFVREAAFEFLEDELPYAVHVVVEEFREERQPCYIRATVHVERETQKGILVGQGGRQIREIGRAARTSIEELLGRPVYLDLWVKVSPRWRRDPEALRRFGFPMPERK